MKILVLNGSPKGKNSITLQSMRYLEKNHPEHTFCYLDIAPKLKSLEKDFSAAAEELQAAEMLIFSYPVYTFLAPYQMHRFLELLKDSKVDISGKWSTQFTTSKHFFDTTAHRFIKENMLDLGLKVLPGLSADMEDLLTQKGRRELENWQEMTKLRINLGSYEGGNRRSREETVRFYGQQVEETLKASDRNISIVTNADENDIPLRNMIADFQHALTFKSTVYNIKEYPFSGGCLGCFSCAKNGKCIHRDGFDSYLRNEIQNASGIVYAFRIKNHFTDSSMKCYDDRQFCNGHRAVTAGRPTAYIIAGDLSNEENLRTLIEARASVGANYLSAIATDETADTVKSITDAAKAFSHSIEKDIVEPRNFYGIGGNKIFRDLVYEMRGLMKADHRFYKANGYYDDFPQHHKKRVLFMNFVGMLLSLPGAEKKKWMMTKGMLTPYEKVLKENA